MLAKSGAVCIIVPQSLSVGETSICAVLHSDSSALPEREKRFNGQLVHDDIPVLFAYVLMGHSRHTVAEK